MTSLFASVVIALAVLGSPYAVGQSQDAPSPPAGVELFVYPKQQISGLIARPRALPRMSHELALATYEGRTHKQSIALAASSDLTVVEAELCDRAQHGVYELQRRYHAPSTLEFTPISFVGDDFVKHNVIVRLLQSEAQIVDKRQVSLTAIASSNYTFKYKSVEELDGHSVYMFKVKPRHKRPGLFKGRIFIDTFTGSLRRAEGSLVKLPSWFVKRVDFVQDYEDVGDFTLPAHLHSVAIVHFIGRATVDVFHRNYQIAALDVANSGATPAPARQ